MIPTILTAFQRNAFQNNAFQIGADYSDGGGGDKVRKKSWRLEDLYNFSKKNASQSDHKRLDNIVEPFERKSPTGEKRIEFEEIARHKIARQQVTNYIRELYNTRQDLKDRLLRLINAEFLKQELEAKRIQEENFFIFLLLLEE